MGRQRYRHIFVAVEGRLGWADATAVNALIERHTVRGSDSCTCFKSIIPLART